MDFPTFANKRIFLTGGTGFFGKSILDCLKRGFLPETEFVVLSRDPERFLRDFPEYRTLSHVRYVSGDVRDFVFPAERFDFVIHAATPAVTDLPPGEMRSIILEGTARVLAFARHCGAERLLFTSSGAVYGPQPEDCTNIPETLPCRPESEYGIAKLEAEKLCIASGIPTLIARCFAFIGPRLNRNIHFAAGNFIQNGLDGVKITIKGDGTPYRSYLYADDLVDWLFALLERGTPGEAVNIGSPDGITIADLARETASHFDPPPEIEILGKPHPGQKTIRYVPDTALAMKKLGVRVTIPLAEAIEKSIPR